MSVVTPLTPFAFEASNSIENVAVVTTFRRMSFLRQFWMVWRFLH